MRIVFYTHVACFLQDEESNLYLISASLKLHPPAAVKRGVLGLGGKVVVARGAVSDRASSNRLREACQLSWYLLCKVYK